MKRFLFLTLAALGLALEPAANAAAPLSTPERAALLQQLQAVNAKTPSFQANFSEERATRLLKKPLTSTGRIAFQLPNKFRRELTGSNPSVTVCNGKDLWLYYPNFKEAEEYSVSKKPLFEAALAALTAGLNFSRVEEIYNLEVTPEEGGGYRMNLTPKQGDLKRIVARLVVVVNSELDLRRTELTLPKGDVVTTTYTAPRRDPVPASTFEFVPPEGANVTRPLGK